MKIEKLPSGSYRIRKMYKGETYTIVFDHKPTQKEAMQAMAAELDKIQHKKDEGLSFKSAGEKYIDSKKMFSPPARYGVTLLYCSRLPNHFLVITYTILPLLMSKQK